MRSRFFAVLVSLMGVMSAPAQSSYTTLASGLARPVALAQPPGDSRIFIVEARNGTTGRIRVYKAGSLLTTPYLSIANVATGSEQGLLGLAFDPNFQTNFRFYVYYTDVNGDTVVARYAAASASADTAIPAATTILTIDDPYENHNGGTMAFGPDGYLYIGNGDGGDGYDPGNRAQDKNSLFGKFLRLDVNGDDFPIDPNRNYRIPPDNPFAGATPGADEIWSFGWRNPWKWAFDNLYLGGTGGMAVADVGQDNWEEVDYEPAKRPGLNYGWRVYEGLVATGLSGGTPPYVPPIYVYSHTSGCSITGGVLYRGSRLGMTNWGRFFFSDYCNARLMSVKLTFDPVTGEATASNFIDHISLGASISSVHADNNGELYFTTTGGSFRRINAATSNWAVQGQIVWQDVAGGMPKPDSATVEFRNHGSTVPIATIDVGVGQDGKFRWPAPTGNIDVSVKGSHFLRRTLNANTSAGDALNLTFQMVNGDVDGDNEVAIGDYSQLSAAYGSMPGDGNWNENADLNGDGEVGIADYSIMSLRYGLFGDN